MGIKMGFAGTVKGMTAEQRTAFTEYLSTTSVDEFRVGGLAGADEQAAEIVCRTTTAKVMVCRLPLENRRDREAGRPAGESRALIAVAAEVIPTAEKKADARRSVAMVDASDVIVLAPKSRADTWGGTVRTYRYARWKGKPIVFVWPDGTVETHGPRPAPPP